MVDILSLMLYIKFETNTNGLALCDCTNANKISFCRARAVEKVQDVWNLIDNVSIFTSL